MSFTGAMEPRREGDPMLTYNVTNDAYDPNPVGPYTAADLADLAKHHGVEPFTFTIDGRVLDEDGAVVAVENRESDEE